MKKIPAPAATTTTTAQKIVETSVDQCGWNSRMILSSSVNEFFARPMAHILTETDLGEVPHSQTETRGFPQGSPAPSGEHPDEHERRREHPHHRAAQHAAGRGVEGVLLLLVRGAAPDP